MRRIRQRNFYLSLCQANKAMMPNPQVPKDQWIPQDPRQTQTQQQAQTQPQAQTHPTDNVADGGSEPLQSAAAKKRSKKRLKLTVRSLAGALLSASR